MVKTLMADGHQHAFIILAEGKYVSHARPVYPVGHYGHRPRYPRTHGAHADQSKVKRKQTFYPKPTTFIFFYSFFKSTTSFCCVRPRAGGARHAACRWLPSNTGSSQVFDLFGVGPASEDDGVCSSPQTAVTTPALFLRTMEMLH